MDTLIVEIFLLIGYILVKNLIMEANRNVDSIAPIPPLVGEAPDIVRPANSLQELREFYESGDLGDDEEIEVELMIHLSGLLYNNRENND